MPENTPSKSPLPLIIAVIAIGAAVTTALVVKDPVKLAGFTLISAVAGAGALYAFPPRRRPATAKLGQAELAPLLKGVVENRTEILNAMGILQDEIRILQDAKISETETTALRGELSRLAGEVAALKSLLASRPVAPIVRPEPAKPAVVEAVKPVVITENDEDDGDFDVAPLSFDDLEEEEAAPAPKAAVAFAPEPAPVLETGLVPEDMDDDGDWLTGGLDEDDLVVTKKVDFEAIVKKDAERPKPVVDEEEQRILREEMAQMADEDDWVGAGLQDRDVKVKVSTNNDALFDKLRAEIEAKRAAQQASAVVRAPARGETALLVNFTVPAGSKLFIRGVGPGLDVEKGVPMQQSGHGKWQWICEEKGKPCVVTVWENDEVQAEGNPVRIPGGFALTITPTFRRKLRL